MAGGLPTAEAAGWLAATRSRWLGAVLARALRTRGAGFGLVVVTVVLLVALGADLIAPYNPNQRQEAGVLTAPSPAHPLGTDQLARDVLSRIIYGTRTSVQAGVVSVGFALFAGVFMGLLAGYYGAGRTTSSCCSPMHCGRSLPSCWLSPSPPAWGRA